MNQPRTVFLDTETTGLHAGHDEILEIALVDDAGHTHRRCVVTGCQRPK